MIEQEAFTMLFGYLSFVVSTGFVLFTAAAAQVSFDADNRSSWIRLAMLIQQVLFFGWIVALLCYYFDSEGVLPISMTVIHYWLFMGAMMSSVPAIMSRRVKRSLPKTVVSRSIMSLFVPGPGRGYLFALANMLGWNLLLLLVMLFAPLILPDVNGPRSGSDRILSGNEIEEMLFILTANCVYGITFLSILFLMLHAIIRKRPYAGPLLGAVLAVLFLLVVTLVPVFAKLQWMPYSGGEYSLLYVTNWYITVSEMSRYGPGADGPFVSVLLVGLGMILFGYLAIRIAGRELHYLPEAIPNRVMEEEQKKRRPAEIPIGESIDEILGMPRNG